MGSVVPTLTWSQHLIMKFVLALFFLAGLALAKPDSEEPQPYTADANTDGLTYGLHGPYPHVKFSENTNSRRNRSSSTRQGRLCRCPCTGTPNGGGGYDDHYQDN